MGQLTENAYSTYELTEDDALQGAVLSTLQRQVVQNELSLCAHEVLNMKYDTEKPGEFYEQLAFMKGQLCALTFRLDASDIAEEAIQVKNSPNVEPLA